jgi:hypothetical protein
LKVYHAEIGDKTNRRRSNVLAIQIAKRLEPEIRGRGGRVEVGRTLGGQPAIIMMQLPDNHTLDLDDLVEGVRFHEVHAVQVPAVEDRGIR